MFRYLSPEARTLLVADNLWYFGEGLLGPLFAVFAQKIGGDILDITWAWSLYLITTGTLAIFIGRLSDKYDKRKLMVAGYFLNAIMTFAYLFVHTSLGLFLVQIGLGIATALATPTWDALLDQYSGDGRVDGGVWGIADGSAQIVTGIAILCGGLVLTYTSFRTLFIVMGVIQTVAALLQTRILFSRPAPKVA